jgi:hypothetical protein
MSNKFLLLKQLNLFLSKTLNYHEFEFSGQSFEKSTQYLFLVVVVVVIPSRLPKTLPYRNFLTNRVKLHCDNSTVEY